MSVRSLQGLEVVVTRPAGQADSLTARLREAGAQVTTIPLMAILPVTETLHREQITRCLGQIQQYQHAIFISQNAAQQALAALASHNVAWPPQLQAYAVGRSTAAWLAQHGISAITPERMDSEGLLALPGLQDVQGQRCVIFRGLGGRETLAMGLKARGMAVDYCELYRRRLPAEAPGQWAQLRQRLTQDNLTGRRAVVVCLNSVEMLDNLLAIDEHCTGLNAIQWLVPGSRVAQAAAARGFHQIIEMQDALDETVLATLFDWQTRWHGTHNKPTATDT